MYKLHYNTKAMDKLIGQILNLENKINKEINAKLKKFQRNKKLNSSGLFIELCFCIIVANGSIKQGLKAWKNIGAEFLKLNKKQLAIKLKKQGIRFYNNKAGHIIYSRKLRDKIYQKLPTSDVRSWLVENVKGLGYKEASHFLRNLGFRNFAILDRHILKILITYKVINRFKSLTPKKYLEIEEKLKKIAEKLRMNLAALDIYLFYLDAGVIPEK